MYGIFKINDIFAHYIYFSTELLTTDFYNVSMLYDLLRPLLQILIRTYFKKVEVKRLEHVKENTPTIFVAAYPASLIDAVVLSALIKAPLFFLVRAAMMQRPLYRFMLSSLHAIPVYKKEDGIKELHKNSHTFDRCRDVLLHNKSVVIFSEQISQPHIPFNRIKKEAARIAFLAEEIFDFKLGVRIIPVNLQYYTENTRPNVSVVFGRPVTVRSYERQYKDTPARAIKMLTADIASALHQLSPWSREEHDLLDKQSFSNPLPTHTFKKTVC